MGHRSQLGRRRGVHIPEHKECRNSRQYVRACGDERRSRYSQPAKQEEFTRDRANDGSERVPSVQSAQHGTKIGIARE